MKRILCVDDHQDICELVAASLPSYKVICENTAIEAVMRAVSTRFDLYIIDYRLPDLNGIELCKKIKEFEPDAQFLIFTGTDLLTEDEAIAAGAKGLVKKGAWFPRNLMEKVGQLLNIL